ncbi:PH domain-containing protein [Streptacidiphilus sp. PAMC 29251]
MDAISVPAEPLWHALPPQLRRMRRTLVLAFGLLVSVVLAALLGLLAGWSWAAVALLPLLATAWGWYAVGRNWRSWRFAEREDDLLITHGVLWRRQLVVPYGRMQAVDVAAGPLERAFGVASVQLHTATEHTSAKIPGLLPAEAERLRDTLAERGEARQAGL